jgi:hypothetical protein
LDESIADSIHAGESRSIRKAAIKGNLFQLSAEDGAPIQTALKTIFFDCLPRPDLSKIGADAILFSQGDV